MKKHAFTHLILICFASILCGCEIQRTVKITSEPLEAYVSINKSEDKTPHTEELKWKEETVHTITVKSEDYETESRELSHKDASETEKEDIWEINFKLEPLVKRLPLEITTNVDPATVIINGEVIGQTPLRHVFEFTREDSHSEWDTFSVVVSKNGYRYYAPNATIPAGENPPYSERLTINSEVFKDEVLDLRHFEKIRFIITKWLRYEPTPEGFVLEEESVLAQVGEIEREPKVQSVTRITDAPLSQPFRETRIDVLPDSETILYSFPYNAEDDNKSMNLWLQHGGEKTRLTDADKVDIEAAVSDDGKWIYFTANRTGTRIDRKKRSNLWRIQTAGRGGLTKITDSTSSLIDTEVAVSPDGSKIVFMSFLVGIENPHIWTANADGTLPTQLRIGRNPSWSPDGRRLAFQAPDALGRDRIWVMEADGSNPTQLTVGDFNDRDPEWTPDGKRIIYASNQALNEEGIPNWDIWIMNTDGTNKTQLTINGSYDYKPTISPDGRYIYFLSNRGAREPEKRFSQIWRIELPEDLWNTNE